MDVQREGTVFRGVGRHTVLPGAESEAFTSLRARPTSRAERFAIGKALRQQVPRGSLGRWQPAPSRPDPVAMVRLSHQGRLPDLVPIRVGRMAGSPYGFLRGTAIVMAEDVAGLPSTGITPVICGDAHLGNFGFYASPEGELVIDLNDFDEAHPGGWEWDLRRLVASIWVAGRENGATEEECRAAVMSCVSAYREEVAFLADQPLLMRSYNRLDVERLHETATEKTLRAEIRRSARRARNRTSDRALPRFTAEHQGARRIVDEPPLITQLPRRRRRRVGAAPGRIPRRRWRRTGDGSWAATPWSTSPTRSSASAVSGCGPTSPCWRAAARTTWSSCNSSRPAARCWRVTSTATPRGTPTRASGWSSTSRRCRRSATRCWAGPALASWRSTCASSAT